MLLIDTNTWHANLIFDNLFIFDDYVSGDNLVTFLQKIIKKNQNNDLVRIVKNDKIVNEYKQLNYCVSAFSRFSNRYNKLCYDSELNKSGGAIVEFLRFINCWSPIFIENIEVIDLNGNTIYFPPMSFHIHPDWHIRIP